MAKLSDAVPIPNGINHNLKSAPPSVMQAKLGTPGALTPKCAPPTGSFKSRIAWSVDVGPFKVSGLDYAAESLKHVFAEVRDENLAVA